MIETPLEAMMKGISYPESENLKMVLDINEISVVKKRMQEIQQNLLQLDQLLELCTGLVKKIYKD